jgi:arylformamidase
MNLWRGYDQAGLDAQYATRAQIGDQYDAWAERWRRASAATRTQRTARLDLAYGSHPRQKLDLFPAAEHERTGPLAVFFHGGFWRSRDKSDYSYVADGLAGLGGSAALINYPLCPEASLGEVTRSARMAVRWLIDHVGDFGIAPRSLFVCGHSAGAHLAAMCFCGDGSDPAELPPGAINGALLSSGLYELEPTRLSFANADLRLNEDQVRALSPARLAPASLAGPILISYGGAETEEFAWQAETFAQAISHGGAKVKTITVPDANHYTIVPQLAASDSFLLKAFRAELSTAGLAFAGGAPAAGS